MHTHYLIVIPSSLEVKPSKVSVIPILQREGAQAGAAVERRHLASGSHVLYIHGRIKI